MKEWGEPKALLKPEGGGQGDLIREFVGQRVALHLKDGEVFKGKLEKASQPNLVSCNEIGV